MSFIPFFRPSIMTLVLLSRFHESRDSLAGYKLCEKLVQDGHQLYVTSTAPKGSDLDSKIQNAAKMNAQLPGNFGVLLPECDEFDEPSLEWIDKYHKTYFGYLTELEGIDTIIGTLPGTTKTTVDLKKALKCKLYFLPHVKLELTRMNLKLK